MTFDGIQIGPNPIADTKQAHEDGQLLLERFKWDQPKDDVATYVERVKRLRATAYKHELYAVALHLAYVGWDRDAFIAAAGAAWDAAMKRDEQVRKEIESGL